MAVLAEIRRFFTRSTESNNDEKVQRQRDQPLRNTQAAALADQSTSKRSESPGMSKQADADQRAGYIVEPKPSSAFSFFSANKRNENDEARVELLARQVREQNESLNDLTQSVTQIAHRVEHLATISTHLQETNQTLSRHVDASAAHEQAVRHAVEQVRNVVSAQDEVSQAVRQHLNDAAQSQAIQAEASSTMQQLLHQLVERSDRTNQLLHQVRNASERQEIAWTTMMESTRRWMIGTVSICAGGAVIAAAIAAMALL